MAVQVGHVQSPPREECDVFKRKARAGKTAAAEATAAHVTADEQIDAEADSVGAADGDVSPQSALPGPYDVSEVPDNGVVRVDVGAMRIATFPDLQLSFETDPTQSRFMSILAIYQDGAMRMQPLAAPRSGGLWAEMRPAIMASIKQSGGDVDEVEGEFGIELLGVVPVVTPDGEQLRQPIRLIAYEGQRWMLHAVFMAAAAEEGGKAEMFEDILRQTVVVRGEQPMAPGDVLTISLPPGATPAAAPQESAPADDIEIGPPEPGVHVTETR